MDDIYRTGTAKWDTEMNIVRSDVRGPRFKVHALNVDRPLCGAGEHLTQRLFDEAYSMTQQPVSCPLCLGRQK